MAGLIGNIANSAQLRLGLGLSLAIEIRRSLSMLMSCVFWFTDKLFFIEKVSCIVKGACSEDMCGKVYQSLYEGFPLL